MLYREQQQESDEKCTWASSEAEDQAKRGGKGRIHKEKKMMKERRL